jgi:hypothetical protein
MLVHHRRFVWYIAEQVSTLWNRLVHDETSLHISVQCTVVYVMYHTNQYSTDKVGMWCDKMVYY